MGTKPPPPPKFVLEVEKNRNPNGIKSSQIKHKRGNLEHIQTYTNTEMRETVDFLDHVTLRDYVSDDQPCKIMRADFGGVDLVGIKGARISGALKGHPREEGSNFGFEHETGGETHGPEQEMMERGANNDMIAQITTGGSGQQGLITDYWGKGHNSHFISSSQHC